MFQRILYKDGAFTFEVKRVALSVHYPFYDAKQMVSLIGKNVLSWSLFRFSMRLEVLLWIECERLVHPFDIRTPNHVGVITGSLGYVGRVKSHFRLFSNAG